MRLNWNAIEQALVNTVARIAPWLAPAPTAWLVWKRTQVHLHWPAEIAVIAALTIECLGITASVTALQAHYFNSSVKYSKEAEARVWLPVLLLGMYLIITEVLTVLLDVAAMPAAQIGAADFVPAIFPLLSLTGILLLAERATLAMRFEEHAKSKASRSSSRSGPGQAQAPSTDVQTATGQTAVQRVSVSDNGHHAQATEPRWRTPTEFLADPDRPDHLTQDILAEMTGKSKRTARRWLGKLADQEETHDQ